SLSIGENKAIECAFFDDEPGTSGQLRSRRPVHSLPLTNSLEFTGTHQSTFLGVQRTGKKFKFDVLKIFRVADGKLRGNWRMTEQLHILQRLGLVGEYDWFSVATFMVRIGELTQSVARSTGVG